MIVLVSDAASAALALLESHADETRTAIRVANHAGWPEYPIRVLLALRPKLAAALVELADALDATSNRECVRWHARAVLAESGVTEDAWILELTALAKGDT